MAEIKKGNFSLNLGITKLSADLSEDDRQCAWELYTEIATRSSVSGKRGDDECRNFEGELLVESLNSLYAFFTECRQIMRKFPVGRIKDDNQKHLGCIIHDLLAHVLRPFLEKWQIDFREWWATDDKKELAPFERQKMYPHYEDLMKDWSEVRKTVRKLERLLIKEYKLIDLEGPYGGERAQEQVI